MKPESKLWKHLKQNTESKVFWTRIESWSLPGVPDLHGIIEGKPFWLELKVHRLKKINSLLLSPHQKLWQIRYSQEKGKVWNLVEHPSSATLFLFCPPDPLSVKQKVRLEKENPLVKEYHKKDKDAELVNPVWQSSAPYDWTGLIHQIESSMVSQRNRIPNGKSKK